MAAPAAEDRSRCRGSTAGRTGLPTRAGPASLAARVLGQLRRDILGVRFRPGAKLPLKVLAHEYDVGLTPLREALALLCGAGLVIQESQRGFTVAPVSETDFADIAACRRRIEPMCLALAITRGDETWRRQIEQAHRRFAPAAPRVGENAAIDEAWEVSHRAYHFALISACGSPAMLGFCMQLHDRFDRYRRLYIPTKSLMAGTGAITRRSPRPPCRATARAPAGCSTATSPPPPR